MVSHYPFDESSNDVAGTRHLTLTSGTTFFSDTPSGTGQSIVFDGSTTRAIYDVTGADAALGNYAVQLYVKYDAASTSPGTVRSFLGPAAPGTRVLTRSFRMATVIHGDIGTGSNWLTTAADAPVAYDLNVWYNVAYAVSPTGYTIYFDGVEVGSGSFSGTPLLFDANHDIAVGNAGSTRNEFFSGLIDDVRIYDTTLTQSQIQANLIPEPSAVSWRLREPGFCSAASAFDGLVEFRSARRTSQAPGSPLDSRSATARPPDPRQTALKNTFGVQAVLQGTRWPRTDHQAPSPRQE